MYIVALVNIGRVVRFNTAAGLPVQFRRRCRRTDSLYIVTCVVVSSPAKITCGVFQFEPLKLYAAAAAAAAVSLSRSASARTGTVARSVVCPGANGSRGPWMRCR